MRNLHAWLTATVVISVACWTSRAEATTIVGKAAIAAAAAHTVDRAAYAHACYHREYSSRRVCWWRQRRP
jgi:hypothetical protein